MKLLLSFLLLSAVISCFQAAPSPGGSIFGGMYKLRRNSGNSIYAFDFGEDDAGVDGKVFFKEIVEVSLSDSPYLHSDISYVPFHAVFGQERLRYLFFFHSKMFHFNFIKGVQKQIFF